MRVADADPGRLRRQDWQQFSGGSGKSGSQVRCFMFSCLLFHVFLVCLFVCLFVFRFLCFVVFLFLFFLCFFVCFLCTCMFCFLRSVLLLRFFLFLWWFPYLLFCTAQLFISFLIVYIACHQFIYRIDSRAVLRYGGMSCFDTYSAV